MTAFGIVALGIVAYVAILAAATMLSQPFRVKVQDIGLDILDNPKLSKVEREEISWLIESGTSSAIGLMLPVSAIFLLAGMLLGAKIRPETSMQNVMPNLARDARFAEMTKYYVLSIMSCSPFSALLSMPAIGILVLAVSAKRSSIKLIEAAEAPVMNASAHFQR